MKFLTDPPQPFTTDGCSGGIWKALTGEDGPWTGCCVTHDRAYWRGGARRQRFAADVELARCVWRGGHKAVAVAIFVGVRIGGHPLLPTPWRWGYGWPWPRWYR